MLWAQHVEGFYLFVLNETQNVLMPFTTANLQKQESL